MKRRIAILTPDRAGVDFDSRWRDVLATTAMPLRAAGFIVEHRDWTSDADLGGYDLVMPLLVWGYHRDPRWQQQLARWAEAGLNIQNSAEVLGWNGSKTYLGTLAANGAPIVPTRFVDKVSEQAMLEAAAEFGTEQLIAKPQVSASAFQTIRWSPGTPLTDGPAGPAMIQPYLPAIEGSGETSLIYFSGRFNHAIRKVPRAGDFRVQPEYASTITPHEPAADELAAAEAVLAAVDGDLLYARIDLVRDPEGRPVLMELELTEPDLYLEHDPDYGAGLAAAVDRLVSA